MAASMASRPFMSISTPANVAMDWLDTTIPSFAAVENSFVIAHRHPMMPLCKYADYRVLRICE